MRHQFTFYKSFDDVYKDLNDKQKLEFMSTLLDIQFLRIKVENVIFKDNILKHIWTAQKYTIQKSIIGYLDSQKNSKITNPFLGVYDPLHIPSEGSLYIPSEGGREQEQSKEQSKGKEQSKEQVRRKELPTYINSDSYLEWISFKKITHKGTITKLINFLSDYTHHQQKEIIDYSMMNGYKGLFPPKQNFKIKSNKKTDGNREYIDAFINNRNSKQDEIIEVEAE